MTFETMRVSKTVDRKVAVFVKAAILRPMSRRADRLLLMTSANATCKEEKRCQSTKLTCRWLHSD